MRPTQIATRRQGIREPDEVSADRQRRIAYHRAALDALERGPDQLARAAVEDDVPPLPLGDALQEVARARRALRDIREAQAEIDDLERKARARWWRAEQAVEAALSARPAQRRAA